MLDQHCCVEFHGKSNNNGFKVRCEVESIIYKGVRSTIIIITYISNFKRLVVQNDSTYPIFFKAIIYLGKLFKMLIPGNIDQLNHEIYH